MDQRSKEEMLKIIQGNAEIVQKIQKSYKDEILKLQKEKDELNKLIASLKNEINMLKNPSKEYDVVQSAKVKEPPKFFKHPSLNDITPSKDFYIQHLKENKIAIAFEEFVKTYYLNRDGFTYNSTEIKIQNGETFRTFRPIEFFKLLYPNHFKNLMVQLLKKERISNLPNISQAEGLCQEIFTRRIINT